MQTNNNLKNTFSSLKQEDIQKINDSLIERFLIEKYKNDKSGILGYTQREMAYNSNRIEGSKLSKDQTFSLFETGTFLATNEIYRSKDVEEMTGHFVMFNKMLDTLDADLSEDLIKKFHRSLKEGVFEDKANGYPIGEYKNRVNTVYNITTALPNQVHERMLNLLSFYHNVEDKTLESLAKFHAVYEMIHPFQDGNGRTGRIILFRECLKNNIIPFIISDENKLEYQESLNKAQLKNNFDALLQYFQKEQDSYYKYIREFLYDYSSISKQESDSGLNRNDSEIDPNEYDIF